jgi:hypothetical protein
MAKPHVMLNDDVMIESDKMNEVTVGRSHHLLSWSIMATVAASRPRLALPESLRVPLDALAAAVSASRAMYTTRPVPQTTASHCFEASLKLGSRVYFCIAHCCCLHDLPAPTHPSHQARAASPNGPFGTRTLTSVPIV